MDLRRSSLTFVILAVAVALFAPATQASAAPTGQPTTAPCYMAAMQALSRQGAIYSQGGVNPKDPPGYPRTGPSSFDCSGLVWWAYAQAGVTIGLTTYQQLNNGVPINCTLANLNGASTTCWTLGDLIFLRYAGGQHVAIYVGQGLFMDCYNHAVGCILNNVAADSFYQAHFYQARRIVSGCEGLTINPGQPVSGAQLDAPALELIPAILAPVQLVLPWQCGDCNPEAQNPILPLPEPDVTYYDIGSWLNWLGVQLWNRVALPIICWMLAIGQAMLNQGQRVINTIFIAGINAFWRIFVLLLLWLRDMFYAGWSGLLDIRLQLWSLYTGMVQIQAMIAAFVQLAGELLNLAAFLLAQLGALIMGIAQALAYLFAVVFALVPALISAVANPVAPSQLTGIANFFLFVWLKETLQAIADSKLGWAWIAFIAMFYARFIMWLLQETSELNS